MKTKLLLLLFSVLFSSLPSFASGDLLNRTAIYGKVGSNGEQLPFITVYVKGTTTGTATDASGRFVLHIDPGTHLIKAQGVGYAGVEKLVEIEPNQNIEINFDLDQDIIMMDQVTVTGSRIGILRYLPGSANIIKEIDINRSMLVSNNEVFRMVSGLHTVEEEGAGLRINIGIRGLDPDKSRNVLMLEDGIPVALGPYGEPEMYYTPAMDRMMGVEVLKGNGQVLYGPQTIGGVINYITADPPAESKGTLSMRGGNGGHFSALARYGNTYGNSGFTITYLRKQADKLGPTQFRLDDLTGKFRIQTGIKSTINLKWGVYNESSNATYIGLTQPMYDQGKMDDLQIAPNDRLDVRRYSISATHDYFISDNVMLKTLVFGYTTTRNWLRQDFTHNQKASGLTGIWYGDETLPEGAIYLRNTTGNRNRQFEVAGIEPRLRARYQVAGVYNQLDAGMRLLYERAFEQRVNGATAEALSGVLRDDEIRTGHALSAYAQNKTMLTEKLTLTSGLRMETLNYERKILRAAMLDTTIVAETNLTKLIPGTGLNYEPLSGVNLFAGIHRGFAPPRIKDAISSTGIDVQLDAEKSWNYELGLRYTRSQFIEAEATLFYMDFSNQVIPVSESSGNAGAGLINGGRTIHRGVELSMELNFDQFAGRERTLRLRTNTTLLESFFNSDRYVVIKTAKDESKEEVLVNVKGNTTPYAPGFMINSLLTYETASGLGANLSASFTGRQFTDMPNTHDPADIIETAASDPAYTYTQATASGRIGEIPAHFVMNAAMWYKLGNSGFEINASVKNLLNERYIVSRRPQGIRVGLPRYVIAGVTYNF